jgi:hypothetical protein
MQACKDFLLLIANEQLAVPTWEILMLLAVVSISLLLRATHVGIFITYVFTLHIAWKFLTLHFPLPALIAFAVLGGLILLLGLFDVLTER